MHFFLFLVFMEKAFEYVRKTQWMILVSSISSHFVNIWPYQLHKLFRFNESMKLFFKMKKTLHNYIFMFKQSSMLVCSLVCFNCTLHIRALCSSPLQGEYYYTWICCKLSTLFCTAQWFRMIQNVKQWSLTISCKGQATAACAHSVYKEIVWNDQQIQ